MSLAEKEFINRFLSLVTQQPPALASDYKKPLQNVTNLGVALPPLKYKYDHKRVKRAEDKTVKSGTIQLSLKSIRAPKFLHSKEFAKSDTINQVKQFLVDAEESIHDASQLKILLKGKVMHDNILLSDIKSDKADLVVMVAKWDNAGVPENAASDSPKDESQERARNQIPWAKIQALLESEFTKPEEASAAFNRLQRGWELADLD